METLNWKAAVWAGVIAGLIFVIMEMLMVPLFLDGSPWGPPRMIGAIVLGEEVLPPPATFDLGIFMAAVVTHMILSVIYAIIVAMILKIYNPTFWISILVGAVFGYVVYLVNFYGFTEIFPWFANARNWVSVFAHISFGIAVAWAYVRLQEHFTAEST